MTLTTTAARELVGTAIARVAPDADVASLADETELRDEVGLDSLDFLSFVELLTERSGIRIDEDDYPRLETVGGCVSFLTQPA